MTDAASPWVPEGFDECLQRWDELEKPPDDLRSWVVEWSFTRLDDPYQGVRREPGFANLWWGVVPGTLHEGDKVVVCSYWVVESIHVVRCESLATLSFPL